MKFATVERIAKNARREFPALVPQQLTVDEAASIIASIADRASTREMAAAFLWDDLAWERPDAAEDHPRDEFVAALT